MLSWTTFLIQFLLSRTLFANIPDISNEEPHSTVNPSLILQPSGTRGLSQSAVASRLLLVATLDGKLYGIDRYSGTLYWECSKLGGALVRARYPQGIETKGPVYLIEPHEAGNLYAYLPGSGIKVSFMEGAF
jgi:outer membrane protein assembly factor BamB